jgi:hypothetical protein
MSAAVDVKVKTYRVLVLPVKDLLLCSSKVGFVNSHASFPQGSQTGFS